MLAHELADLLNLTVEEVNRLLSLSPQALRQDPAYLTLVQHLNPKRLNQSAPQARAAYNHGLEPIKEKYGLSGSVMNGYSLVNGILDLLTSPDHITDLMTRHAQQEHETMTALLPELIDILGDMSDGGEDWQHALAVFSLPLLAHGE